MKTNLFTKISITALLVFLLAGCGVVPVRDINGGQITGQYSQADIGKAIKNAGIHLGWDMEQVSDGHILGSLHRRIHLAFVDITYDTNSYSINYKDSQNLSYDGANIHHNYNVWVQNLNSAILARTGNL